MSLGAHHREVHLVSLNMYLQLDEGLQNLTLGIFPWYYWVRRDLPLGRIRFNPLLNRYLPPQYPFHTNTHPWCCSHAIWMDLTPSISGGPSHQSHLMALATVVQEWTCDLTWPKQRSLGFSLNISKSVSLPRLWTRKHVAPGDAVNHLHTLREAWRWRAVQSWEMIQGNETIPKVFHTTSFNYVCL